VKRRIAVATQAVLDPAGQPAVLLQLPPETSWVTMAPSDARRIAAALLDAAAEVEGEGPGWLRLMEVDPG
jgi:hypothetical protein